MTDADHAKTTLDRAKARQEKRKGSRLPKTAVEKGTTITIDLLVLAQLQEAEGKGQEEDAEMAWRCALIGNSEDDNEEDK